MDRQETIDQLYIKKVETLMSLASYGYFENIVYMYQNQDTFLEKEELIKLFRRYLELLELTETSNKEAEEKLLEKTAKRRHKYKEKATKALKKSYNLDFEVDKEALTVKSNGMYDDQNIDSFSEDANKDYLTALIDEELKDIKNYDKFTLSNTIALLEITDRKLFEDVIKTNILVLPEELIQNFLDNILVKANGILKPAKEKEFTNPPLTKFDFYSTLFNCQSQLIILLTFFDQLKDTFDTDILEKDNFYALKKILIEDDIYLLDQIVDINEQKLNDAIDDNEDVNEQISLFKNDPFEDVNESMHKYVDFLEEVLFEDLHFFIQSVENYAYGMKISDEIVSTFNELDVMPYDKNATFNNFFNSYYKLSDKLSFGEKLIFNKSVFGLTVSQLIFIGYLKSDITVNIDKLSDSIKKCYATLTLDEIKLLSAYICE